MAERPTGDRKSPTEPTIRRAVAADLPALVALLMDDPIEYARGGSDTGPSPEQVAAFTAIDQNPDYELIVLADEDRVVGSAQLVFIHGLNWNGGLRCQIQGVRVDRSLRGQGSGTALIRGIIEQARMRGCVVVQLSTHHDRIDAHRLYHRLGFEPTHVGLKLRLI